MRLFGLIGFPLSHSFSKKYFTEKFEKEGLSDCRFENFTITSAAEIKNVLQQYPEIVGLNVTIPHKKTIISFLDDVNEVVKKINACNCIKKTQDKLIGYNTDIIGFERSLKKVLDHSHKNALILGTGGSSNAIEYVLKKLDIN